MNFLVAANEKYMYPLKVMLTSLLDNNRGESHNIYFLYSNVCDDTVTSLKKYVEKGFDCKFNPRRIQEEDFKEFPVSHHFSIETYYRFLAQDIVPQEEDRVLWLDADMIVRKPLDEFYYQDFEGKSLVVCRSINTNPQAMLDRLDCPPGAVYFNAGTVLFNLNKLRGVTLKDYYEFYEHNKERIMWLDQDILNAMYALDVKIADYRIYNMQMFSAPVPAEDRKTVESISVIVHYIGNEKPWNDGYANPYKKFWLENENKLFTPRERIGRTAKKCVKKALQKVKKTGHNILYPIRRFHGALYEWNIRKKKRNSFLKYLQTPKGKKAIILGTPAHNNIGDSAIVVAQMKILERCGFAPNQIKEVPVAQYNCYADKIEPFAGKQGCVFWHGGGNMGDIWPEEEKFRQMVLKSLPDLPVVIFPQTIDYRDESAGNALRTESFRVYNSRKSLTLIAREKQSFYTMQQMYPDARILLTPDIVLSANAADFGVVKENRSGILLCMRSDIERNMSEEMRYEVEQLAKQCKIPVKYTDMYADCTVTKENREECVRRKMQEFAGAELVITDRLHGMVFAAITGTPCIAFSNNNHKVRGTYEWIKYLPYIRYAEGVEAVEQFLPELLAMENCKYDSTPLMPCFDQMEEVVKKYAHD